MSANDSLVSGGCGELCGQSTGDNGRLCGQSTGDNGRLCGQSTGDNGRLFPVMLEETLFYRWLEIKETLGFSTDSQIAHLLLERYAINRKHQTTECLHCHSPLVCSRCQTLQSPPSPVDTAAVMHSQTLTDTSSVPSGQGQGSHLSKRDVELTSDKKVKCISWAHRTESKQATENAQHVDVRCAGDSADADEDARKDHERVKDYRGKTNMPSHSLESHEYPSSFTSMELPTTASDSEVIVTKPCECEKCGNCCERVNILSKYSSADGKHKVKFECTYCDQLSSTDLQAHSHTAEHDEGKPFSCEKCKSDFMFCGSLQARKVRVHGVNPLFRCRLCGAIFRLKSLFEDHMIQHQDNSRNALFTPKSRERCEGSLQIITNRQELPSPAALTQPSQPATCQICHKVFKFQSSWKVHMRSHLKEKTTCTRCKLPFKSRRQLVAHLSDCCRSCQCTVCGKSFPTKKLLEEHALLHSIKRPFACRYCERVFQVESALCTHVASDHQESKDLRFRCDLCHCGFKFKKQLAKHAKVHRDEKPHVCGECGAKFKKSVYLQRHEMGHEDNQDAVCHVCGKCCLGLQYLTKHMKTCHNANGQVEKLYKCPDCTASFSVLSLLTVHQAVHTHHAHFMCHHCGRAFKTQHTLTVHMRKHTGERPFQCSYCQESFIDKRGVKRHELQHNPSSQLCHVCGASFPTKALLAMHLERHSGERPFQCKVCGKGYKTLSDLTKHMKYHSDDKPFQCSQCPYAFHTKAMLRNHQRKHTGETPFKCQQCSASFRYLSSLAAHRKRHSGNKPFACDVCGATFFQSYNLRLHYRKHSGEKPYKCRLCPESFAWHSGLKCHMKKHQPEMLT